MNVKETRCRARSPALMWALLLIMSSGCAGVPVIRGTSVVLELRDGDVVRVPPDWEPRVVYGLSPVALEELLRAAGRDGHL